MFYPFIYSNNYKDIEYPMPNGAQVAWIWSFCNINGRSWLMQVWVCSLNKVWSNIFSFIKDNKTIFCGWTSEGVMGRSFFLSAFLKFSLSYCSISWVLISKWNCTMAKWRWILLFSLNYQIIISVFIIMRFFF